MSRKSAQACAPALTCTHMHAQWDTVYNAHVHTCMHAWMQMHAGSALLFFDMDIAGSKGDRRALHASCPTLRGTKVSVLGACRRVSDAHLIRSLASVQAVTTATPFVYCVASFATSSIHASGQRSCVPAARFTKGKACAICKALVLCEQTSGVCFCMLCSGLQQSGSITIHKVRASYKLMYGRCTAVDSIPLPSCISLGWANHDKLSRHLGRLPSSKPALLSAYLSYCKIDLAKVLS